MAVVDVKYFFVDEVPTQNIVPHALYFVKSATKDRANMYKANAAGTGLIKFSSGQDVVYVGEEAPPANTSCSIWLKATEEEIKFYLNLTPTAETPTWVDPVVLPAMPAFAGNGEAETMSRSDHWHDGIAVQEAQW